VVKAIIQAEESRMIYRNIREIIGKNKLPLTQVDVPYESNPSNPTTALHEKSAIEHAILNRNRRHSLQLLETPFMTDPIQKWP